MIYFQHMDFPLAHRVGSEGDMRRFLSRLEQTDVLAWARAQVSL